jgi:hypothetical protein
LNIFGILKWQSTILDHLPEYSMAIQAHIPPALAAVHNFIHIHDEDEILEFEEDLEDGEPGEHNYGELAEGSPNHTEKISFEVKQDETAQPCGRVIKHLLLRVCVVKMNICHYYYEADSVDSINIF